MQKLLLLLILSFFSAQSYAASCPDGSEPEKTVSADGTYYEYKCASDSNNDVSNKTPIDQDSILASKLEKRRTINVFRAWDLPDTYRDVYKYHYGLYFTVDPKAPEHTIKLSQINWNFNYLSYDYDDYDGIEEFILKKDWIAEEEYPSTYTVKFWDDDFAEYISDVSHELVNQYETDGVMLDWWRDEGGVLPSTGLSSAHVKKARTSIAAKLREKLGNNAVMLGNVGWDLNIATTEYINGVFLELYKEPGKERYTANDIAKMEDVLYFYDKYLQEPRIIAMAPWRVSKMGNSALIPRDAEENIRYAKLFAAMAMVIPENGYILYSDNNWDELDGFDYGHQYYDFYNIDLGKATSKVIEVTKGVAYKKHQNGYIAFNRLGYDVTVDFGDFQSVVPSMEGVFLNEDGTPYVGCEDGFIKKNGICEIDNSPLFSEDFENDVRVNNWLDNWSVRQDSEGNSIYCNETSSDWASFTFGRDDWNDYSVSLRMKFPTGYSRAEIYFRINQQFYGYRLSIDARGYAELGYWSPPHINLGRVLVPVKRDEWMQIQLIFSGNNLKFLFDGEVVTEINDDKRSNGLAGFGVPPNNEVCVDDIVVNKI
jgi:hypothetical protein